MSFIFYFNYLCVIFFLRLRPTLVFLHGEAGPRSPEALFLFRFLFNTHTLFESNTSTIGPLLHILGGNTRKKGMATVCAALFPSFLCT